VFLDQYWTSGSERLALTWPRRPKPIERDERQEHDGRARSRDHDRRHTWRPSGRSSPSPAGTSSGTAPSPRSTLDPAASTGVLVAGDSQSAGEYVRIVPKEKVVFTFGWEQEGSPDPAGSTTSRSRSPRGDKTLVPPCASRPARRRHQRSQRRLGPLLARRSIAATGGNSRARHATRCRHERVTRSWR